MNHGSIWRRMGLGLTALAFSLSLHACSSTGQVQGEITIPVPFGEDIVCTFSVETSGSRTFDVDAGPTRSGRCFEIRWYDEDGNEISTTEGVTDQNGQVSGTVPDEATHFEGELVPCPKPESGKSASSSKMLEPPTGADVGRSRGQAPLDVGVLSDTREYFVFGGPLLVEDATDDDHFTFGFRVRAAHDAELDALVDPILQGGIGTPVPAKVEVLRWTTMETTLVGGRLTTAQPGQYESWNLVWNDGAFTEDLLGNVSHYAISGWDVVEVTVPLSAFDQGLTPGVTYENHAALSFKTDRMPSTKVLRDGYEFTD